VTVVPLDAARACALLLGEPIETVSLVGIAARA
jgi:hypothetical protein